MKYKQKKLLTQPCDIKFNETSSKFRDEPKKIKKRALTYNSNTLMTTKVISKTPLDSFSMDKILLPIRVV